MEPGVINPRVGAEGYSQAVVRMPGGSGMTLFEHLSIAGSLLFSFSVVRVLSGFSYASAAQRRYWPHLLWMVAFMLAVALSWWQIWSFEKVDWSFLAFLLYLAYPCSLFLVSAALVPVSPDTVADWEAYFFLNRRRVFLTGLAAQLIFTLCYYLLLPMLPSQWIWAFLTAPLFFWGAMTKDPKVHAVLPVIFIGAFVVWVVLFAL